MTQHGSRRWTGWRWNGPRSVPTRTRRTGTLTTRQCSASGMRPMASFPRPPLLGPRKTAKKSWMITVAVNGSQR